MSQKNSKFDWVFFIFQCCINRSVQRKNTGTFSLLLGIVLTFCSSLIFYANDGAAEVAVGGIILKKEPRISMKKERLTISMEKITVEYEFLNQTSKDITTTVVFPIPDYDCQYDSPTGKLDFNDFHIWVDNKPVKYQIEARAFANGKDVTKILRNLQINIENFGDFDPGKYFSVEDEKNCKISSYQVKNLSKTQQTDLIKQDIIWNELEPKWTVKKSYYWPQLFPAHGTVRIKHEYRPVPGCTLAPTENLREFITDPCISGELLAHLKKKHTVRDEGNTVAVYWVKYILTTANTWKTPIEDFEVIIDKSFIKRPKGLPYINAADNLDKVEHIHFCWDYKVEKLDDKRFITRIKGFVPTKELTVYFF